MLFSKSVSKLNTREKRAPSIGHSNAAKLGTLESRPSGVCTACTTGYWNCSAFADPNPNPQVYVPYQFGNMPRNSADIRDFDFCAESLCEDCLRGDKIRFAAQRAEVLALSATGETLVDAVEAVVEDRRLRPGVFLTCWGRWSHEQREKVLERYREACEKPGLHPEVLAPFAALDELKHSA